MVHESWSMTIRTLYLSLYLYMNKNGKNRYELERTILHSSIEYSNLIGSLVFWQAMNHLILPILLIRYFNTRKNVSFFNGNLKLSILREKKMQIVAQKCPNVTQIFQAVWPKDKARSNYFWLTLDPGMLLSRSFSSGLYYNSVLLERFSSPVMDGFIGKTFLRLLWYREKLELFLELFFAWYQSTW